MRAALFPLAAMIVLTFAALAPGAKGQTTYCDPAGANPDGLDLRLPMPGGGHLVLRPVFIGAGAGPFASRPFIMGDLTQAAQDYPYLEDPTAVWLGGAFLRPDASGQNDWMYFIGKYELSQGQYNALTQKQPGLAAGAADLDLPARGLTWPEVHLFLAQANTWLRENQEAVEVLASSKLKDAFFRLPTEAEWEFAARGGLKSSNDAFAAAHPYKSAQALDSYEFHNDNARGAPKPIGRKKPNPLGLHDMLGNVAELSESGFSYKHGRGRTGGPTFRGASFKDPRSELRVSRRFEFNPYPPSEVRVDYVGLRVVLVSPVDPKGADLPSAWHAELNRTRVVTLVQDAVAKLQDLEAELERPGADPATKRKALEEVRQSLLTIDRKERESQSSVARANIHTANQAAFLLFDARSHANAAKWKLESRNLTEEEKKNVRAEVTRCDEVFAENERLYVQCIRTLGEVDRAIFLAISGIHIAELDEEARDPAAIQRSSAAATHAKALAEVVSGHVAHFAQHDRLPDKWFEQCRDALRR